MPAVRLWVGVVNTDKCKAANKVFREQSIVGGHACDTGADEAPYHFNGFCKNIIGIFFPINSGLLGNLTPPPPGAVSVETVRRKTNRFSPQEMLDNA